MNKIELLNKLDFYHIPYTDKTIYLMDKYKDFILEQNKFINLTSIDEDNYYELMVLDSLLPTLSVNFKNKKIIDIGTGAGFPGTVIEIFTGNKVDLLDSTKKKLDVIKKFPLIDFNTINERIEDYAKKKENTYDIIVVRAVKELRILLELCVRLLKVNGVIIALKGKEYEKELTEANKAMNKLHLSLLKVDKYTFSKGEIRSNIVLTKTAMTDNKYPRIYSEIIKNPL